MDMIDTSREAGKKDAERFIRNERIELDPFISISDLHLVRKTVPISFASFRQTVLDIDSGLWAEIDESVLRLTADLGETFDQDGYAEGFAEGVAAVWEKIRDQVL